MNGNAVEANFVVWAAIQIDCVEDLPMTTKQVHRFSHGGKELAIDTRSLSLMEFSPGRGLGLRSRRFRKITEKLTDTRSLDEELIRRSKLRKKAQDYLYLNISHACNLACHYCFAQGGSYGEKEQMMGSSAVKSSIDWILEYGDNDSLILNFFGGEPLLNPCALHEAITYGREQCSIRKKAFQVAISTNGTLNLNILSDVLFTVNHRIVFSIDGPASIHNNNRPFTNGRPSYCTIAANVKSFIDLAGDSNISAKATWVHGCSDLVSIAKSLTNLGFHRITIARETSVSTSNPQTDDLNRVRDFDEIFSAYDDLSSWYVAQLNQGKHLLVQPLFSIMQAVLMAGIYRHTCSAGVSTWCVTPSGQVYPCHRFVPHQEYCVGDVSSVDINSDALDSLSTPYGSFFPGCDDCWARYWCLSGSCFYLFTIGQDYYQLKGFCNGMRKYLEMICYNVTMLNDTGREMIHLVGASLAS